MYNIHRYASTSSTTSGLILGVNPFFFCSSRLATTAEPTRTPSTR